ncbi:MAG: ABC-type transport auxiliary lipoprotein family protein [Gemmatimonadaceae bacterium]
MREGRVVLVLAVVALACFRARNVPPVEMYRLLPTAAETASVAMPPPPADFPDGSVAVSRFVTPGLYGQRGIVYRIGESGYATYGFREWAIPLGEMLGRRTADLMQERPLVREGALFDPPSRRNFAYSWRGTVREFEEINRGNEVFVAVSLEANLVRIDDDSIVWSGSGRSERPVPDGTIEGIIAGLSAATDEVLLGLIDAARVSIRQRSANGSTPGHE